MTPEETALASVLGRAMALANVLVDSPAALHRGAFGPAMALSAAADRVDLEDVAAEAMAVAALYPSATDPLRVEAEAIAVEAERLHRATRSHG